MEILYKFDPDRGMNYGRAATTERGGPPEGVAGLAPS